MHLERLEISGFKSFAVKTVFVFPPPQKTPKGERRGITVIVGPNGSGKSNIADAIRWVLGEQSLKMLRGKKTEDVIFSGSDKKAQMGMAEVSLYLNNEDRGIDIDYPEVVITRKIYRDGTSEYIINKKQVRLQDVILLSAKANFGQKSYSVIGQGMIDSILHATPVERKDFFDEAVGVKQYQIKREQSIHKLENTWKNLKQAQAVLEEITPRLRSLTRQVNRLEKREMIEKLLQEKQRWYYGSLYREIIENQQKLLPKQKELDAAFQRKSQELSEIQNQLNNLEKEDSRTEIFNRLQKEYQKIIEQKNALKERQLIIQNTIELARQRETIQAAPIPYEVIIERLKRLREAQRGLMQKLSSIRTLDELASLKESLLSTQEMLNTFIEDLERPKQKTQIKQTDPSLLKELNRLEREIQSIDRLLDQSRKKLDAFNKTEEQKKGKFFELQRNFQKKQNEYNELSRYLSEVKIELAKLETKREDLLREIREELGEEKWVENFHADPPLEKNRLFDEIRHYKHQLELIGGIDPEVVNEYRETKERYDFLNEQCRDLSQSIESLKKVIFELDETIHKQFHSTFKSINREFQKYFKTLFQGGHAEIILLKETEKEEREEKKLEAAMEGVEIPGDIDEEERSLKKIIKGRSEKIIKGVEIVATPPGKKLKSIQMLSGGERALTSIALICAIIANNPSPFVVLDEVDAALDEANSERFSAILEELSYKTQFIVITHNRATMHRATVLYGVMMGDDGVSRLLSLYMEEAERLVNR